MAPFFEIQGVSKRFGGLKALTGVDMTLDPQEILGVIGPNGAGKTTLFNLISGVFAPSAGTIRLRGEAIEGRRPHRIARLGIGRTFQVCQPFLDMTVLQNVLLAYGTAFYDSIRCFGHYKRQQNVKRAMELLDMVGLGAYAERSARDLGLAMQRRMEIARALALDPQIILLDESAAGLTHEESLALIDLIRGLKAQGMAVMLIEHNMRVAMEVSERIYVLDHGELICQGRPQEVQQNACVIEAYLGKDHDYARSQ